MDEIMVSVLCTAYNHEKYIKQALDGILMQETSFAFEIIVHDDASKDKTTEIIREYEAKYSDIVKPIYQTENQYSKGVAIINEFMLPKVRGKYVAICEGDDYWTDKSKLELQVNWLESHPEYSACCHNALVVNEDMQPLPQSSQMLFHVDEDTTINIDYLYDKCKFCHTATLVMRTEVWLHSNDEQWDQYGFRINGDMKWCALSLAHGAVYQIARVMSCYRLVLTNDSWSARNKNKNIAWITYRQLEAIRKIIYEQYGVEISYQGYYDELTVSAIIKAMKSFSKDNFNIARKLVSVNPHKINLLRVMWYRVYGKVKGRKNNGK